MKLIATPQPHPPRLEPLLREALAGLTRSPKTLPSKLFYDERGSALFDQICQTPEYYLTRTELAITQRHAADMAQLIGPDATLIELGSGSSIKTRLLLDHLDAAGMPPRAYVPVDISGSHLTAAARRIQDLYPHIRVHPLHADYTQDFTLPPLPQPPSKPRVSRRSGSDDRTVIYFPGSTIGNFEPADAVAFLKRLRHLAGRDSAALIGVDLIKDPAMLHAAYNDAAGITAAFNLNLLHRLNREADADLDPGHFAHYAFYAPSHKRIEMHLISRRRQTVHLAGHPIAFDEGESIHTENSYKYTPDQFHAFARDAGYQPRQTWIDAGRLFSIHYLTATNAPQARG